ncbi:PilZ domain-containing protein [Magnetospirillum sp. UT-4]|uniref:PilZ domain-containing protein n=1 Tax=Magnetospirillum sp. UT-4 TaxID=2681467 RepID=UPI00138352C2|nr:PilZ domain-containing protein [Magnetospirillum sp. UT-4]CAA7625744.1 hypothetical protein MTBUT4_70096 [Magnetospirillum sp. UT-4]
MTKSQIELRAFPRLSCSRPARLLFPELEEEGQVVDVSAGGCKFMPFQLETLAAWRMPPGLPVRVLIGGQDVAATVAWATPNYSAIGCHFTETIDPHRLAAMLDG